MDGWMELSNKQKRIHWSLVMNLKKTKLNGPLFVDSKLNNFKAKIFALR